MSDDIYNNVTKTGSERMNRERVEMTVDIYESADCVGDHDFRTESNTQQPLQNTGSDSVKTRCSRAAPVCLVLLCFFLLIAVIVLSVFIYTNNTNYTKERRQLITNITNLTGAKDELTNLLKERDQLIKQLQICCKEAVWFYYQSSFYYLSNETKSWTESRRYCRDRGADLIIINNKQEQDFIMNITGNNEFWIGVTDSEKEGIWKWVDGSKLTSRFWASYGSITEPNGETKENCAVTHLKKHPELKGWLDITCNSAHQWICEKNI
ncbi:hepatic lectin-like [Danio aesculapii]|uniref:hepatic lectin-like n=1 Tax=Danio aesculapii TaxID=1142201 RepID=UPI0024C096EF|nr:hepatic lectin-like [Danio aesculapii]